MDTSIKVLIVDDFATMRRILKNILKQLGFKNLLEADDGTTAYDLLENQDVDLIISDWNMPKMTGVEFSKAIREKGDTSHIPIIMVTAEKSMGKVDIALNEGGANEYITKPFTADKMHKTIKRYFDEEGQLVTQKETEEKKSFFSNILKS